MISLRSESCQSTQNDENQISDPRRLAKVHRRQAMHQENPEWCKILSIAWRLGVCRQAVPLLGTPNHI